MPKGVVVITGPTATGKTKLGIELAKKFGGEVISADSMQLYKYMDIGTATPDEDEMEGIPHHLIDIISPFGEQPTSYSYPARLFPYEASLLQECPLLRKAF